MGATDFDAAAGSKTVGTLADSKRIVTRNFRRELVNLPRWDVVSTPELNPGQALKDLSESDMERYEIYRRISFSKVQIKKFLTEVAQVKCTEAVIFVVSGFAKVFVADVVERAREAQCDFGDVGPLMPKHV